MSDLELEKRDEKLKNDRATNDFLSFDERKQLRRLLSSVEEFPREFGSWIQEYLSVNGQFTRGQIQGLSTYTARVAQVSTDETTSSGSYTDLATVGPQLTGLGNGQWLIFFGATMYAVSNSWTGYMSIAVNDDAAASSDEWAGGYTVSEGVATESLTLPGMRVVLKDLDNQNNNTITAKYKSSGISTHFVNRWLIAQKVGN